MEPSATSLGEQIKARRKALDLTQEHLAELADVRQGYISALESGGRKKPGHDVMVRLADALKCSTTDLTGDTSQDSIDWFWKAKFTVMSDGDLLRLRRMPIESRAQWIVTEAVNSFGADDITKRTALTAEQLQELLQGPVELAGDQANKLKKLDLPRNFLLLGQPDPRDEDLELLLNSPDSDLWLRFFRKCHEANVLPSTVDLLLAATLEARQTR